MQGRSNASVFMGRGTKPKMSMKDWIRRAYGENFVTVLIDTIVMGGIYFYVMATSFFRRSRCIPRSTPGHP